MLRVDDEGVLIIDNTNYSVVDVSDFRPNVDITLTVLEGTISVGWPLNDSYFSGDSAVFQVGFSDDVVRIYNDNEGVSRVLLTYPAEAPVVTDIYNQPAIVPAAVSSELDNHGEERIHIAPLEDYAYSELYLSGNLPSGEVGDSVNYTYLALGGLGPYRFNIVSGSLPEGTTMGPVTAHVTGAFTVPGFYTWRVQVEDRLGNVAWVDDTATVSIPDGIACGVQSSYEGGVSFPTESQVVLGSATGLVELRLVTGEIPDKVEVWIGDEKVLDTGYYGNTSRQAALDAELTNRGLPLETITQRTGTHFQGAEDWDLGLWDSFSFIKESSDPVAVVKVYAPLPGTGWIFALSCPGGFPE